MNVRTRTSLASVGARAADSDITVQNMPRSFDGTLGTTSNRGTANKVQYDKSPQPEAQRCRKAYDTQSGRTLAPPGTAEYGLTLQNCDSIRVLERAAKAAGSNLTRASVSRAVPGLGAFPVSNYGAGAYRGGRADFVEQVRFQVFRASCSCWEPAGASFEPRSRWGPIYDLRGKNCLKGAEVVIVTSVTPPALLLRLAGASRATERLRPGWPAWWPRSASTS